MKKVIDYLVFLTFYTIGKLIAYLPLRILYFISDLAYYVIYYIVKYRKKVVFENLKLAFPEKKDIEIKNIAKKYYRHFCDLFIETIKLLHISESEMKRRFHLENPEIIKEEFDKGKHIFSILSHFNNWEWGSIIGKSVPHAFVTIYKPLSNSYFDRLMIKIRTKFNHQVIPMNQTARYISQYIKDKRLTILNFLSDQSPMRHEVQYWANFFNQPTAVYLGVEKMAIKTRQPVYFLHFKKIKRGYYSAEFIKICEDASILKPFELTDIHTKILENIIRENPQYWLWTHRRWKIKPENN